MISVEDVTSCLSFLKEKVGLTDQKALYELMKPLVDNLSAPTLGQINRTHSHIRLVARKMLALVEPTIDNVKINQIVESLTEKINVHGHSISRNEAKQIGIQAEDMDIGLEEACWELFLEYEQLMKLNSPNHPLAYFLNDNVDEYREENAVIACIESTSKYSECSGPFSLIIRRSFPQPVNININIPIQLPVGSSDFEFTSTNIVTTITATISAASSKPDFTADKESIYNNWRRYSQRKNNMDVYVYICILQQRNDG
jgi:hypothetical protein